MYFKDFTCNQALMKQLLNMFHKLRTGSSAGWSSPTTPRARLWHHEAPWHVL